MQAGDRPTKERRTMKSYADFPEGARFRTDALTVTESHIVGFAGLTGDFYRIHMDEEFSRTTEFGARIAQGPLVYSIAMGQVFQARIFTELALALLGVDRLRHLAPCYIGSTIHTLVTVTESRATSRAGRGIVKAELAVENQDGQPLLECEIAMLTLSPETAAAT